MSKIKTRILCVLLGSVLTLAVLWVVAWQEARTQMTTALNAAELMNYQAATTNFFAIVGRWPTSARELFSNSTGLAFINTSHPGHDAWGREIIYEPYSTNVGYGKVASYGRNGILGGMGADADIEFRFP